MKERPSRHTLRNEARLNVAVDLFGLGLFSWNPRTGKLRCDDAVRAMWGLPSHAKVENGAWRAAIHRDDLGHLDQAVRKCLYPKGDGIFDVEYRVIGLGDGIERWIAARGLMSFANRKPHRLYGAVTNITEDKRAEGLLERRVEELGRELDLVNSQLREQIAGRENAEAAAERSQRLTVVGEIASGIAHDFNNLVSIVLTNVRLLEPSMRRVEDRDGLALIRIAAERGAEVTAQLLAFAREQRPEPQVIDLNARLADMSGLLTATLGTGIHVEMALAPDLHWTLLDPTQLEMIVLNLCINARDAMKGVGTLTLRTFNATLPAPTRPEHPPEGSYAAVRVEDTGSGIEESVLPHVFKAFFTTKEAGRVGGLGLTQVLGIVRRSGGGIGIESHVGKGTSVSVFLPVAAPTPALF
ncbi:MAG TPA: ATP-binding protein [Gemmataceae bacterium]|nr:ATP-binding protein [Gemmataceae bacterium]